MPRAWQPPYLAVTTVQLLARLLLLALAVVALVRLEVLPSVHQCPSVVVGMPLMTPLLRHLLLPGPVFAERVHLS